MVWRDDYLKAWGMWAVIAAAVWVCALATPQPLHLERDSYRRPHQQQALDWQKRDQVAPQPPQLLLRSPRASRQYDVPQIGKWYTMYLKKKISTKISSKSRKFQRKFILTKIFTYLLTYLLTTLLNFRWIFQLNLEICKSYSKKLRKNI